MKKVLVVLLALIMALSFASCGKPNSEENKTDSDVSNNSVLSDDEIKNIAAEALYNEVRLTYGEDIDPDSTTYNINKIERRDFHAVRVYGTYSVYDNYGNIYDGEVSEPFTVTMNSVNGEAKCDLYELNY